MMSLHVGPRRAVAPAAIVGYSGALIAPDGAIDWLCAPQFDAPSMFGSILDRQAGTFRLGPYGINHPTDRHYEPEFGYGAEGRAAYLGIRAHT